MILERTAAYVLAVAYVFQMLLPSWTIKSNYWRSIDVQIGSIRIQARNEANSACFGELAAEQKTCASATRMPLLHSWQKEPKRLKICINNSDCIMAWLDGISHAWMITKDESGRLASGD